VAIIAMGYRRALTVAIIVIIWGWHAGNDLPVVVDSWRRFHPPLVTLVAWAVFSAVGLVATVRLRRRGAPPFGRASAWTLLAVLLVTELTVFWACPVDERFRGADWVLGTTGWFGVAVLWHRRGLVETIGFLGLHTALASGLIVHNGTVDPSVVGQYLMIAYGTGSLQLAFAVGYRATDAAAQRAAASAAATAEATTRRIVALAVHKARQDRYQAIRDGAMGLMAGLSSGALDPADPVTRQRAAIEAARLRRLLAEDDDVPEPLLNELRAGADVAERRGVEVDLVSVGRLPVLPASTRRALVEPPITVLSSAVSHARITVVALLDDVVVSVIADSDPMACGVAAAGESWDRVTVTHQREGALLWTETRWRGRSGSPSSTTTLS
jgi:hypothetical protein